MRLVFVAVVALVLPGQGSSAGPLPDRIVERRAARLQLAPDEGEAVSDRPASLPAGVQIIRDVPYGADERQRFDVYRPARMGPAPVIFFVHGGAWRFGDKANRRAVEGKLARWAPLGFAIISTNYRMLPTDPIEQARDVSRALVVAQKRAGEWGLDRQKFVLMGHSAGAHLVMLLATSRSPSPPAPWLGVVALDSGALDVVEIMEGPHLPLFDRAFGRDPDYWRWASPFHRLTAPTRPALAVCSTRRTDSCAQARRFAAKARSLGSEVSVLEKNLSHGEINVRLGEEPTYTAEVEAFLARLDKTVARVLAGASRP